MKRRTNTKREKRESNNGPFTLRYATMPVFVEFYLALNCDTLEKIKLSLVSVLILYCFIRYKRT